MKEQYQSFIYSETLLSQLYRKAAAYASNETERMTMLSFANDALTNANYMNYFYKTEYGVNYDPIIPEVVINGGYREFINEIIKLEIRTYQDYKKLNYNQNDLELKDTIEAITDMKLGHILTLLAILTNLNTK